MVKCPVGTILRSGYKRKAYTRSDGRHVKAVMVKPVCIPDKGKPGKTPASAKVLPKPTVGALSKYGYYNIKTTPASKRRASLRNAVKNTGYATIIRRINLIANYNKLSDPVSHKIMRSDIAWIQNNLVFASKRGYKRASKRSTKKGTVKAGKKIVAGRSRQLYHVTGSTKKFYLYKKTDGTLGRRYI